MAWSYHMPTKIVFGVGSLNELPQHVNGERVLLVTGGHAMKKAGVTDRVTQMLGDVTVFDEVEENPSHETVDTGVEALRAGNCDQVVALGGGSSMDAAKMMAMIAVNGGNCREYVFGGKKPDRKGLPFIAIPTTAGTGSEVTQYSVISDHEKKLKRGFGHDLIFPDVALLDPELTMTMPKTVTASTGADALSHAIEAYWTRVSDPLPDSLALQAIGLVFENLEKACDEPDNTRAREQMLYASMLAGIAISQEGVVAAHSISHSLTAHFGILHGNGCLVVIPPLVDHYAGADPRRVMDTARASGVTTLEGFKEKLAGLMENTGMVTRLGDIGMREEDVPAIVKDSFSSSSIEAGPGELTREALTEILREMI